MDPSINLVVIITKTKVVFDFSQKIDGLIVFIIERVELKGNGRNYNFLFYNINVIILNNHLIETGTLTL
jgi:hypothetical protein